MKVTEDALAAALESVVGALRRGQHDDALELALSAWQSRPAGELGELVEALSWLAARDRAPIAPRLGQSLQSAWLARADEHHPADVDVLMSSVLDATRSALAVKRVRALEQLPPHPRLARALQDLIDDVALSGHWRKRTAEPAAQVLASIGDPRSKVWAESQVSNWPKRRAVPTRRALEALLRQRDRPAPAPLDEAESELCETVLAEVKRRAADSSDRARRREEREEVLLKNVYAAPAQDAPRLVYADWLAERGDPRGELILLQIERAGRDGRPSTRERELLRQYGHTWLGPLAVAAAKTGNVLARGFPAAVRLSADWLGASVGAPAWATVDTLDLHALDVAISLGPLITHPAMRSLTALRGLSGRQLTTLADLPALPIRAIDGFGWGHKEEAMRTLAKIASLPHLVSLGLQHTCRWNPADVARVLRCDLGRRLEHLVVGVEDVTNLDGWWPVVHASPDRLRSVELWQTNLVSRSQTKGVMLTLTRDRRGPFHRAAVRLEAKSYMDPATMMSGVVRTLDHDALTELEVDLPKRYRRGAAFDELRGLVDSIDGATFRK